ncbi:MAG: hypothetical protein K6E47_08265 [Lachnospiraceae bacterium]|nr:hypothetical protein [Lachnospiraceae bacterium]
MDHFAVIDTETTWSGALMTAGVLIVETGSFKVVASNYYIAADTLAEGGLYSHEVHMKDLTETVTTSADIGPEIHKYLTKHNVKTILAYNAGFDRNCLSYLRSYRWCDIMRLAAYKQYNSAIPENAECCKTGKLKRGYGVEPILRMLGKDMYYETHNALIDAMDELEIVRLLGHPVDMYPEI